MALSPRHPLRRCLTPLSSIYAALIARRNAYFDRPGATRSAAAPVISVGNITTGGTGKTPFVMLLVRCLLELGRHPAILTRGYGAREDRIADEVAEYQDCLPGVPVVVDRDRVRGAATALAGKDAAGAAVDCLVLDDGFQHRRLARDLDLVLVDALDPWGGGRVLPAGNLREDPRGLVRANAIVISRANQVSAAEVETLATELRRLAPQATLLHAETQLGGWQSLDAERGAVTGKTLGTTSAAGPGAAPVLAVCGIGNPETFARLLTAAGLDVRRVHVLPDHYCYRASDVARLANLAGQIGVQTVVTTRKDWVKLAPLWRTAGRTAPDDAATAARAPTLMCAGVQVAVRERGLLDSLLKNALRHGATRISEPRA